MTQSRLQKSQGCLEIANPVTQSFSRDQPNRLYLLFLSSANSSTHRVCCKILGELGTICKNNLMGTTSRIRPVLQPFLWKMLFPSPKLSVNVRECSFMRCDCFELRLIFKGNEIRRCHECHGYNVTPFR